ncbi:class I SAM-dependent methyltransferase [Paenibacillus sp. HB172176]|uniref:class I SAM-dependent methyltransferase n=1 Tax=Paenibacillus sp. HB172176 TaxID=2493690 RepID=UPI001438CD66|nr:class I SAM-dependent methyltransferase [Paenibacillus sp. HB172176]
MKDGRESAAVSMRELSPEAGGTAGLRIFIVRAAFIVFFVLLSPIYYLNRYDLLRQKKKNPFYTSKLVRFMYKHPIVYEIALYVNNFPKPSRVYEVLPELSGEVLQVGCGTGLLNKYYRNNSGVRFTNLDVSLPSLELGKRMGRFDSYVHGDICKAPLRDESFDAVLFARCFHHIRRTRKALEESCRLLKPGGIVIVADPVLMHKTSAAEKMTGGYMINSSVDGVIWKYTLEGLKEHLLRNMPADLALESTTEKRLIHMTNYNLKYPHTDAVMILRKLGG